MSVYHDRAAELRACTSRHYNCAQSVVMPFAAGAGLDEETAWKLAQYFGGGMRRGSVCGAVTGALMTLGLCGLEDPEIAVRFQQMIKERHGGNLDCSKLLQANAAAGGEKKPFCDALVLECTDLAEELLREYGKL